MSTLGRAVIEFSADTARFTGDVGRAEAVFGKAVAGMTSRIADLRNLVLAAAGAGGVVALVKSSIDAADSLGKLSQKIGISVERLSELKFAASLADTNLEAFTKGMKGFNEALIDAQNENAKAAELFKALGVDIRQGPYEALRQFADGLSSLKDGALKTAISTEVLKKGGLELIPMLNQGSKGLDEMADKARRLGLVFSPEVARRAEEFNDNLKILGARSEALGIALTGKLVEGLAAVSKNFADAAESGTLFSTTVHEVAKGIAVLASLFPKWTELGKMGDRAAEFLFGMEERIRSQREMGKNLIDRLQGKTSGTPPVAANAEAAACALSGGKWENGKCVRPGTGKGERDTSAADYARSLAMQQDVLDEAAKMGAEFLQKQQASIDEHNERLRQADIAGWVAHAEAVFRAADEENLALAKIAEQAEKTSDIARELGMSFSSAFEDAIVGGKKLSEVIRSLEQDIIRLITRELVTKPLAESVTSAIKGSTIGGMVKDFFGSIFGGGKAEGGPVAPGQAYVVGERGPELFVPAVSGQIVPAGAGAVTLNMTVVTPDAASFRAARAHIGADMVGLLEAARRMR